MSVKLGPSYYRKNTDWECVENRVLRKIIVPKREKLDG